MKRYSISTLRDNGFQYWGRTDDLQETIAKFKVSRCCKGIRITDSSTKKVIHEEIRPYLGALIVTLSYKDGTYTRKEEFVDLDYMSEQEYEYKYGAYAQSEVYKVEKVERQIYR